MDRARIFVDFNALLRDGVERPMPLSKTDSRMDSDGNTVALSEGVEVYLYEADYDEFDRRDNLIADGTVVRNPDADSAVKWCCQIDARGVRHESDDPAFQWPEFSEAEKRAIIYEKLEEWAALIGSKPNDSVKRAIGSYMNILKEIDRSV